MPVRSSQNAMMCRACARASAGARLHWPASMAATCCCTLAAGLPPGLVAMAWAISLYPSMSCSPLRPGASCWCRVRSHLCTVSCTASAIRCARLSGLPEVLHVILGVTPSDGCRLPALSVTRSVVGLASEVDVGRELAGVGAAPPCSGHDPAGDRTMCAYDLRHGVSCLAPREGGCCAASRDRARSRRSLTDPQ